MNDKLPTFKQRLRMVPGTSPLLFVPCFLFCLSFHIASVWSFSPLKPKCFLRKYHSNRAGPILGQQRHHLALFDLWKIPTEKIRNGPNLNDLSPKSKSPFVLMAKNKLPVDNVDEKDWEEEDFIGDEIDMRDMDDLIDDEEEDDKLDREQPGGNEDDDEDDEDEDIDYELFDEDDEDDDETPNLDDMEMEGRSRIMTDDEWDEDEDGGEYPLQDDPDDPNYQIQKKLVEAAMKEPRLRPEQFDAADFITNKITPEQAQQLDELPFLKEVEERAKELVLTEQDITDAKIDLEADVAKVSDLMDDDPYERHEPGEVNLLEGGSVNDDDLKELDDAWKIIRKAEQAEPWDKVMVREMKGFDGLSNETLEELDACLEEIGGSAYNVTRWLLYDLDFNVSNLILAAVKHNREAPVLLQHWYPQLVTYKRYQHARDRDFDFTWDDVENADMSELEKYYLGFGYSEIPKKAPGETGIISFEDLDEEEIKMAAFENWMTDVYNPEWDRKDFDDDEMRDEDNVFSDFYEPPQHPDLPTYEDVQDDLRDWREEIGDDPEDREYRDFIGRDYNYTVVVDEVFEKEFRGHLVVACTASDEDLEIAEKITLCMEKQFGKQVYVETRVMELAREEDNVFEVWLESYEIDLLHSKRRATSNTKDWSGPALCDQKQIDYLVDKVRFLISDDARYSYRMDFEHAV